MQADATCAQHGNVPLSSCWHFHAESPENSGDATPGGSPSTGDRSRSVSPYPDPQSSSATSAPGSAGEQPPPKKKSRGKQKIDIQFIKDKNRRFTTFSKRKTGLMKKAYELAALTGAHVLLLVASETGHVYTYTTDKLNDMVESSRGKALIEACLSSDSAAARQPEVPFQRQQQQQQQQQQHQHQQLAAVKPEIPLPVGQQQQQQQQQQHAAAALQRNGAQQQQQQQQQSIVQLQQARVQLQPPIAHVQVTSSQQQQQQQQHQLQVPISQLQQQQQPLQLQQQQQPMQQQEAQGSDERQAALLSDRKGHVPASLDLSSVSNVSPAPPVSATFSPAPGSAPILQIPQSAFSSSEFGIDSPSLFNFGYVPVRGQDSLIFLPFPVSADAQQLANQQLANQQQQLSNQQQQLANQQ